METSHRGPGLMHQWGSLTGQLERLDKSPEGCPSPDLQRERASVRICLLTHTLTHKIKVKYPSLYYFQTTFTFFSTSSFRQRAKKCFHRFAGHLWTWNFFGIHRECSILWYPVPSGPSRMCWFAFPSLCGAK